MPFVVLTVPNWHKWCLLISNTPADLLFSYPHGDVLFDNLVQIVGHGNDVALLLLEQLKLFKERGEGVPEEEAPGPKAEGEEPARSRGGRLRLVLGEVVSPDAGIVMRRLYV